ncbi:hypothetical protein FH972_025245 [Carpinus fangiana]|nr:hypothetical protein FH972_025245 [Carpinus fangiana]
MMGGTSPYNVQSPSFHSSSYLPKMEANFWNNLRCCEMGFKDLHELLQHFEEVHSQQPSTFPARMSQSQRGSFFRRKSSTVGGLGSFGQNGDVMKGTQQVRGGFGADKAATSPLRPAQDADSMRKSSLSNVQDIDTLGDMELDDDTPPPSMGGFQQPLGGSQSQLGINTGIANDMHDYQESVPNTPTAARNGLQRQNNPIVSSVNTPTMGTPNLQNDDGAFGDADGLDGQFSANLPFNQQMMQNLNNDFGGLDFNSTGNDMPLDMCINDPAKALFSADGGINSQQFPQFGFMNGAQSGNDEAARRLQAQQLAASRGRLPGEEDRPFKCPVIGCEKAYKNANGLRYHEKHGHSTQKLKENGDGTFSIVDPVTSIPYPGTVGMEKEKPYRCEVCGKRYKNLNGLKYHRNHSPPCNPEFNFNNVALPGMQQPNMHTDSVF